MINIVVHLLILTSSNGTYNLPSFDTLEYGNTIQVGVHLKNSLKANWYHFL